MKRNIQFIMQDQINIPALLIERFSTFGLSETQLAIILQIYAAQIKGIDFLTPEEIAQHLTISTEDCTNQMRQLMQKDFLSIEEAQEDSQVMREVYSLEPLWTKLYTMNEQKPAKTENKVGEVFQKFEREFGRPLSPFEIEMINNWIDEDNYDLSLIYAALREAVLMGKINFKYIDRILIEWQKKGIKTSQEAQQTSKSFHTNQQNQTAKKEHPYDKTLYYNWLED
ncbi:DnaD domain-containing protein [Gracilibacillus sp. S3-1-1]|uniref:DnaD domain-containing protein n=1 Tax=Gracilibacillus pellucidus TaxID=3095368 RepID=A0ACC6M5F2_9BACI|nr:DnaD domain-containing protein [Gracilibacillus sp. S3-1-1]MDX8046148.1 DnaD domain-containing protein [Gracilibacillus sp. S3-1-1]